MIGRRHRFEAECGRDLTASTIAARRGPAAAEPEFVASLSEVADDRYVGRFSAHSGSRARCARRTADRASRSDRQSQVVEPAAGDGSDRRRSKGQLSQVRFERQRRHLLVAGRDPVRRCDRGNDSRMTRHQPFAQVTSAGNTNVLPCSMLQHRDRCCWCSSGNATALPGPSHDRSSNSQRLSAAGPK